MNNTITIEEINKWLDKVEPIAEKIEIFDSQGESMLNNMKAYVADSKHFRDNGDLVRSFEAMVWAWAIFEICRELGVFTISTPAEQE